METALKPHEDAYGQILLATLEGRPAQEVMERDDGLIYVGSPADYFAPFRRWPAVERRAMRFVRGRVLDVGCGAGRVSLHLQQRGHDVVAIDESPLAVEVARRRGVADAHVRSLAGFSAAAPAFETIVLLRNNIGLAGSTARVSPLLEWLSRATTARGRIVTDSVDPDRLDEGAFRDYVPRARNSIAGAQRFRVRWGTYATPWFSYLMLGPASFELALVGSGWHVAHLIDDGSPRYAAVLEKDRAIGNS